MTCHEELEQNYNTVQSMVQRVYPHCKCVRVNVGGAHYLNVYLTENNSHTTEETISGIRVCYIVLRNDVR